jgi:outer membrane protein OmpA-like peptidoglycan-associated protein
MQVDTTMRIDSMVNNIFLTKSISAMNIRFSGAENSIGVFRKGKGKFDISKGLILSTGRVSAAVGPNDRGDESTIFMTPGDPDLAKIAHGRTYDASVLEFDFIPVSDSISFRYIFASEEYPEYVGSHFNDVFAFFLSGPGIEGQKNLAVLPEWETPVTVNSINQRKNSAYFTDNNFYNNKKGDIKLWYRNRKYLDMRNRSVQYDGYTHTLIAKAGVVPYHTYHIKIAIADVEDHAFDSGVFLEANSFQSFKKDEPVANRVIPQMMASAVQEPEITHIDSSSMRIVLHINFAFDSDVIPDSSYKDLLTVYNLLYNMPHSRVEIYGHTDSVGTEAYNRSLSGRRANAVAKYLEQSGIPVESIYTEGKGFGIPVASNSTDEGRARNRRVEFIITRKDVALR